MIKHCVWIIRGWAAAPPFGELPPVVHRWLPKVDAAMTYAQNRAQARTFGG